jgi:single-strand DNA-binding protein
MAASNINRVVLTGNLTRDPELRSLQSGTKVCGLRIASNTRQGQRRVGRQGQLLQRHRLGRPRRKLRRFLTKGRPVAIDGRLEWREWTGQDDVKHEAVEIVADAVQFLASPNGNDTHREPAAVTADDASDPDDIAF